MKNAYAGGGDDYAQDFGQFQDYMQDTGPAFTEHIEASLPADHVAEDIVIGIGDAIGYWPILGLIVFGAIYFFRKKIRAVLLDILK